MLTGPPLCHVVRVSVARVGYLQHQLSSVTRPLINLGGFSHEHRIRTEGAGLAGMASNEDILHALGRVEEGVKRIREDFQEEKQNARESRAVIHARLDSQAKQISHLDTTVAISGEVDARIREEIKTLKETVERNHAAVQPALDEWKRMKTLGVGISGLIAFAGLTAGGIIAYIGDGAVAAVRHWLKID